MNDSDRCALAKLLSIAIASWKSGMARDRSVP
jgi:hypothetical protein